MNSFCFPKSELNNKNIASVYPKFSDLDNQSSYTPCWKWSLLHGIHHLLVIPSMVSSNRNVCNQFLLGNYPFGSVKFLDFGVSSTFRTINDPLTSFANRSQEKYFREIAASVHLKQKKRNACRRKCLPRKIDQRVEILDSTEVHCWLFELRSYSPHHVDTFRIQFFQLVESYIITTL